MASKKRRSSEIDDSSEDSFSECDDDDDLYCEQSDVSDESGSDDDDTIENESKQNAPNSDNQWKSVPSTFSPRMTIPTYQEPQIYDCDKDSTIMEIFLKLFPKSLFIWIAECTNERLQILSKRKGKEIKATDPDEIMVVIGCLLVMSFNRVPHMKMYWSKNKSVRNDTIATAIIRDRFMLLHSKLYFNHPSKPNGVDKTYYTSELVSCLIFTFNRYRTEATHQSIDEFMVKFKGRTSMKQYVPIKPVKVGMKGFCRADADTGYVYYFYIYQGQEKQPSEGTLGERVCLLSYLYFRIRSSKRKCALYYKIKTQLIIATIFSLKICQLFSTMVIDNFFSPSLAFFGTQFSKIYQKKKFKNFQNLSKSTKLYNFFW